MREGLQAGRPLLVGIGQCWPTRVRELFTFAWPICVANIMFPVSGTLTTLWIGRYLGESDFAISVTAFPVASIVVSLLSGFAVAAGILLAQSLGAGAVERAVHEMRAGVLFQLCATALLCGAAIAVTPLVLQALGLSEQQVRVGTPYLRLQLLALIPNTLIHLLNVYLRAYKDSKTGLRVISMATGISVLATPALVFGVGPLPALSMNGVGVAECIAYSASLGWLLRSLHLQRHPIMGTLSCSVPVARLGTTLRWIVPRGLALGLQTIVMALAAMAVTVATNGRGVVVTAAFGAAAQMWGYVNIPIFAIGIALSNLAAREFGAANLTAVEELLRSALVLAAAVLLPIMLVGYAVGPAFLQILLPEGSASLAVASTFNAIVLWAFVPYAIATMLLAVCKAVGDVYVPLVVSILGLLGVRAVFLYAFRDQAESVYVAWSISASMCGFMLLALSCYYAARWRR